MFENVRNKKAEIAIVPIENSRAGRVADTQRLIPESNLKIIGEYFLEVNHCLLSLKDASIKDIKSIYSHEQAIAQCRNNIIDLKKDMVVVTDTAGAAKMVFEKKKKENAAIASELAAETYNLNILKKNFQDSEINVTRFLIMSSNFDLPNVTEKNLMTTLVFELKSIPAALYKSLGGFATNQINMTKLESFSVKNTFAQTNFYLDLKRFYLKKINF